VVPNIFVRIEVEDRREARKGKTEYRDRLYVGGEVFGGQGEVFWGQGEVFWGFV